MSNANMIFIGVKGTVIALDRATGQEVWRSRLKRATFVNVVLDQGELYATTRGEIFRLDPATGQVCWNNRLPGMGFGLITVANAVNQQSISMIEKQRRDNNDAASASGAAVAAGVAVTS
jgi:outer membrane protein assembly factor BamB